MSLIGQLISSLLIIVDKLGYLGIFLGMAIESSIIPIPSEAMLIPAGALIAQGKMNFLMVFTFGLLGSLIGSMFTFFVGLFLGRKTIEHFSSKYGKIFFIGKNELDRTEEYYKRHGEVTTFVGRLLPGVRHLISLPAGFSKMNVFRFCLFTGLGAGFWSLVLIWIGWLAEKNKALFLQHPTWLTLFVILIAVLMVSAYIIFIRHRNKKRIINFLCNSN